MSSLSSPEAAALPPPKTLAIHLDLVGGIAGDMFAAAMIDALPSLEPLVTDELAKVKPAGAAMPAFESTTSGGLRARRLRLDSGDARPHHGTPYAALRATIAGSPLGAGARTHALAILHSLGTAEASVHGVAIDDVHFHELADWDSLLDVVAAGVIASALQGAQWSASALPLGGGTIHTAHGTLPVPGPATTWLATSYAWRDDGVAGERVTPTGAAILRHLVPASRCAAPREGGRLLAAGQGAGTRMLPGVPNVLRALVFERASASEGDTVTVIEFDVDDMTGEEIATAAERLRSQAGAIDITVGTRAGKKGRPVADFRLLAQPHAADEVARACFVETSTLGLRVRDERRRTLARADVSTVSGAVKVAQRPDGARTAKAAHDDVAEATGLAERRARRAAGEREALERDE
jgi:uncharacterized protein (TIGR00299 family) protein